MSKFKLSLLPLMFLVGGISSSVVQATPVASEYTLAPLSLTQENTPLVMIAMSNDEQLYYKAYPDYTDIDGDGVLDVFYKGAIVKDNTGKAITSSFDYAGYFDPALCYSYSAADKVFRVAKKAVERTNVPSNSQTALIPHSCDGDDWSGNFLNWLTMTRVDVMRHVLYGGKRSTDHVTVPTGKTHGFAVLENSYIPNDVHSFSKVVPRFSSSKPELAAVPDLFHLVPDSHIVDGAISFCVTHSGGIPVLRAAKGDWPFWASKEGTQCNNSGSLAPSSSDMIGSNIELRVEVCASDAELTNPRCRLYENQSTGDKFYKPVGLLQKFGEDGRIKFGLLTGSYHRNFDGGVVRSEIARLAGNTNSLNEPTPELDEIDLKTGAFNAKVNGIIQTLSRFKIVNHNNSKYTDCATYKISPDDVKAGTSDDRRCSNWGNPISEIYYEALRYFSGKNKALPAFSAIRTNKTDVDYLPGLNTVFDWTNPLNSDNYCAKCSIILISSGAPSYDNDIVNVINGDVAGLSSKDDLIKRTNEVGNLEYGSLAGQKKLASDGDFCVGTTMGDLSTVSGTCPDKPQSEGSYHVAGLAYHARITDLQTLTGEQRVRTYAIELADSVPTIDFLVNDKPVSLVPACQSYNGGKTDFTYCSLNDIRFRSLQFDSSGNLVYANIYVMWEDSQWGNDFDMDLVQRIDICTSLTKAFDKDLCKGVDIASGEFYVDQQIVNSSGGLKFRTTYSVVGTTADGLFNTWSDKTGADANAANYDWYTAATTPARITSKHTVNATGASIEALVQPLFLAAKYGGFTDLNGNNKPDLVEEWDVLINETGAVGSDGIPDNYYKVRNPNTLESQLSRVFNSIVERVAAGSNAAVVANRASGNGAIYQAVYYPKLTKGDNTVSWIGQLHSLFVDSAGLIREDTNGNMILDAVPVYKGEDIDPSAGDFIINIYFDDIEGSTLFQRYMLLGSSGDAAKVAIPYGAPQPIESVKPIWNAARSLANLQDDNLKEQRNYTSPANGGRYIFTTVLDECDGQPCIETVDFTEDNLDTLAPYLGYDADQVDELLQAKKVINFVRGIDQPSMRSRQFDIDDDGALETWRLGDIVHSTPLVVEKPLAQYDRTRNDKTYAAFVNKYNDRRRMVYVGANDGKLHAFNGGFWNAICSGFYDQKIKGTGTDGKINKATDCKNANTGIGEDTAHPVGTELWAYAPMNLLPHLRWLTEGDYAHVYYVDGEPQAFDARIFEPSTTHPNGWGTILVVPMRQGGLEISVEVGGKEVIKRSAYIVLDITDPEQPPAFIAEITDENMGLTLGKPTLVSNYQPSLVSIGSNGSVSGGTFNVPSKNEWYLVFGSGPNPAVAGNQSISTSSQEAVLYAFDLKNRTLAKNGISIASNSFFTGFQTADWDGDAVSDAVYFGSVSGGFSDQAGSLFRLAVTPSFSLAESTNLEPKVLLNTAQPLVAKPISSRAANGDRWVHFGTGRYFVQNDRETQKQQSMYGIKEPIGTDGLPTWSAVEKSTLLNASEIKVDTTGAVWSSTNTSYKIGTKTIADFDQLKAEMATQTGWYRNLTAVASMPSGRTLREPLIYQDQLIFTEFLPSADQCDINGRSNLNVVSWLTGTALPYNPLSSTQSADVGQEKDVEMVDTTVNLGTGEFSGVTIFETSSNIVLIKEDAIVDALKADPLKAKNYVIEDVGNCVFVQSSTGEMICRKVGVGPVAAAGRQSWRELEILF